MTTAEHYDREYLETLLAPIRVCACYKPKMGFGGENGWTLKDFQKAYRNDAFYSWFGLDNPLMYAAHKAAGGMTSIYRQIGIGSECLFRKILQNQFDLTEEQVKWSYMAMGPGGKERKLTLDGRIALKEIADKGKRSRMSAWMKKMAQTLQINSAIARNLQGVVFEVRQGYKSKDSKRQNADIANAATAYTNAYIPCVLVMSTQFDIDILHRYRMEKWAALIGNTNSVSTLSSTYAFSKQILGYDLVGFFKRNAGKLREEIGAVLESLLSTK